VQRHFYALPNDLLAVFSTVESRQAFRYTAIAHLENAAPQSVLSGGELPTLRELAPSGSAASGHSYLVTLRDTIPVGRPIQLARGGTTYAFDPMINPDSIALTPGARHSSQALLYGRIASATDSAISKVIFECFKRAIGKHFRRINSFWVGPEAEAAWRQGVRLTIGVASPPEYDLRESTPLSSNNSLDRTRDR
jgi:hypothetical protein